MPCASPVEWVDLPNGHYSFAASARDRLGNTAQPERASFLVDTVPPAIDNIACPVATQDSNFSASFSASDSGSGVNSTDCWSALLSVTCPQLQTCAHFQTDSHAYDTSDSGRCGPAGWLACQLLMKQGSDAMVFRNLSCAAHHAGCGRRARL